MDTPSDFGGRQNRYDDEAKARALAVLQANGGNTSLTAKQLNIPRATIQGWRDAEQPDAVLRIREEKRDELAERFERVVDKMLDIIEARADELSPYQAAIVLGITVDKMRLLRGEATAITSTADDERSARLRERYTNRIQATDAEPSAN